MKPNLPVVVFADLDDTLLDPHTHSSAAAARALAPLAREGISLVFCSRKTRAELELIQEKIGVRHPFICENGGAVFVPQNYFAFEVPNARDVAGYEAVEFGRPYAQVVEVLHRTADRLRIDVIGFSDMSVEEVAVDCGLPLLQARLAKLREYEEPFRILELNSTARGRLVKGLSAAHLRCTAGGRYEHVGAAVDKDVGVDLLCALYRRAYGPMLTVGLADASNDVSLLRRVDVPLIVQNEEKPATSRLLTKIPTARVTTVADVTGWAEGIVEILQGSVDNPPTQVER